MDLKSSVITRPLPSPLGEENIDCMWAQAITQSMAWSVPASASPQTRRPYSKSTSSGSTFSCPAVTPRRAESATPTVQPYQTHSTPEVFARARAHTLAHPLLLHQSMSIAPNFGCLESLLREQPHVTPSSLFFFTKLLADFISPILFLRI